MSEAKVVTWFKVDDGLHGHPKAIRAGSAAMGLWVMAGSWCADQLTDGFVPAYMIQRLSTEDGLSLAQRLQAVGLWDPAERDGDTGWCFHDWADMQPSRQQVRDDRAATAKRQRDYRERKAAERAARSNASGNAPHHALRDGATHAATDGATHAATNAAPTRPDPTTTRSVVVGGSARENEGTDAHETHDSRLDKGRDSYSPQKQAALASIRETLSRGHRRSYDRRPALPDHLLNPEAHVEPAGTNPPDPDDLRESGSEG